MIRILIIIFVVFIIGILGLGAYLSPDDLSQCETQPSAITGCNAADAIVAVSGGNTPIRTAEAIKLYKNGWGNFLIFSGAARDSSGPSNAEVMRTQAIAAGVPTDAILIDETSQTTHENAQGIKELAKSHDISSILVVTSPYHQRRAGLELKQIMGSEAMIRNHPAKNDPDWPTFWWLTPRGWWLAGGELAKIIFVHAGEQT